MRKEEYSLRGGWFLLDQMPRLILLLGCVPGACEDVVPLKSVGVLCAEKTQGRDACFQ